MEKNRDQYKRLIKFLAAFAIMAVQTGIFAYVWFHYYTHTGANFFVRGNYAVIGLYALMVFFFFKIYGGFKVGYLRVFDVLYSQILALICANAVTYLQLCLIGRWAFMSNLMPMLAMTGVEIVVVVLWVFAANRLLLKLYPPIKMVLVYGRYSPDGLARKISTREDYYDICEMISIEEDIELIKDKIREYRCATLTDIPAELRNQLLKFCFDNDIRCYCVPKISDIMVMSATSIHQFDTSLLLMRNHGLTADQRLVKRIFDVLASLVAIILASPFMLIIALSIKLYDRGPVIFKQERLTKDGRVFEVYKFRSMRVKQNTDGYCMTRKDDDRITPVGKVIRALHFDELPQLFNILRGDMSFVGPRPECPKLAEDYSKVIPEFRYRLKVKAGLTGYAQVYGKYNTTPYDKLKLDLTYIENYSFLLDLKLMLLTFKVLFQRENTEGIESWQTSAATKENLEKIKEG